MEHSKAQGRYICYYAAPIAVSCRIWFIILLKSILAIICGCNALCQKTLLVLSTESYFLLQSRLTAEDDRRPVPCEISSKKLKDLGFSYKFGLQDIIHQTVSLCVDHGFLQPIGNRWLPR